jgi:aryl-alcohol dehydrogenase-like predicted oxidoreductase
MGEVVMDFVTMGRSGLKVSRVCLGAMNFGTGPDAPCDEAEAQRVISTFLDSGANFIDTANIYTEGQSEEVVGRAIRSRRDEVVLATKAVGRQGPGPNDMGASRVHLTRALEASLRRLGTDYVDLYQMHRWVDDTPIEETMATLDSFVQAGKVRYIGCSNFTGSQIVEAQWAASVARTSPFISLQPRYSLLARDIEEDVLPACMRHGLGTLVYSPIAGGMLSGRYRRGEPPPEGTRIARRIARDTGGGASLLSDRAFDVVDVVAKIAAELGTTPTAVSIAWVLSRRGVTCAIIGPRSFEQYEGYLPGFELALPSDAIHELNAVSKVRSA